MNHRAARPPMRRYEDNPLALPGLFLAIFLGPIGLAVSAIAMTRRPRGVAIAGVIVGSITTLLLVVIAVVSIWAALRVRSVIAAFEGMEADLEAISSVVEGHMESEGAFPASLGDTTLTVDDLTDPWGNPYSYSPTPDSANWLLTSSGPDGTPGTEDDVVMDGYLHSTAAYIIYETQKMVTGFGAPRQVSDSMSASINVARLTIAVRRYREAHDTLPASLDDVPGLVEWMRIDPWDHPYELIVREDGSFYVRSLGADGTPGTRDDLTIDNSSVRVEMSP